MSELRSFLFEVRSPTLTRVATATLIAPPVAMALYGVLASVVLSESGNRASTLGQVLSMTLMACLYGSGLAYLGMFLVGLPTFLGLRALGAQRGVAYIIVGAGFLPLLLVLKSGGLPGHSAPVLLATMPGLLVAGCWWLFASR